MKVIINGNTFEVQDRVTVLDAARQNGIPIPSLCDHPDLVPFTGCRLCLVQIKGIRNYVPACSTQVRDGMEVNTSSPKLRNLRKKILELILTEHPNACLICTEKEDCDDAKASIRKVGEVTGCVLCPNNGRCELQKVVEEIGIDRVSFPSVYRELDVHRQDPFFEQNYNLCVLCGRCVRVCHEIRGNAVINFLQRGSDTVVGTPFGRRLLESSCQFCGACVDVCPTGALTEKGIKYEPSQDETAVATVCPLCSVGCRMEVGMIEGRILNTRPLSDSQGRREQVCVRGRFTLRNLVESSSRVEKPLIRKGKHLEETDWEEALEWIAARLKAYRPKETAVIGSGQISLEEGYLLNRFASEILKTKKFASASEGTVYPVYSVLEKKLGFRPVLNFKMETISQADVIFLLAGNMPASHPLVWINVLKAVKGGAELITVDLLERRFHRHAVLTMNHLPGSESFLLAGILKELMRNGAPALEGAEVLQLKLDRLSSQSLVSNTGVAQAQIGRAAGLLGGKGKKVILFASDFLAGPDAPEILTALWNLSLTTGAELIPLGAESNTRGLFELEQSMKIKTGPLESIYQGLLEKDIKALWISGRVRLPKKAKPEFLVVHSPYHDELTNQADAVLPAEIFTESKGVSVNQEGKILGREKISELFGSVEFGWKVVSRLSIKMGGKKFLYKESRQILKEICASHFPFSELSIRGIDEGQEIFLNEKKPGKARFLPFRLVRPDNFAGKYPFRLIIDPVTDAYRNYILSDHIKGFRLFRNSNWIRIHPRDGEKLGFKNGDPVEVKTPLGGLKGIVKLDSSLPVKSLAAALVQSDQTTLLGRRFLPAKVKRG